MTTQTQFVPGDRVVVVGGPSKKYHGVTGVVKGTTGSYVHVDVDDDWRQKIVGAIPGTIRAPWDFYTNRGSWVLELEAPAGPEPYEEWFKE